MKLLSTFFKVQDFFTPDFSDFENILNYSKRGLVNFQMIDEIKTTTRKSIAWFPVMSLIFEVAAGDARLIMDLKVPGAEPGSHKYDYKRNLLYSKMAYDMHRRFYYHVRFIKINGKKIRVDKFYCSLLWQLVEESRKSKSIQRYKIEN